MPVCQEAVVDTLLEDVLREVETLPEEEQRRIVHMIEAEVRKSKEAASPPAGRWARLADRLSKESPLEGKSEEFLRHAREFREGFVMMEPRDAD